VEYISSVLCEKYFTFPAWPPAKKMLMFPLNPGRRKWMTLTCLKSEIF